MVSLFAAIDTDGSGAIDAEELGMALEMMGLNLSMQMVVELIDSVDDDGELAVLSNLLAGCSYVQCPALCKNIFRTLHFSAN